MLSVMMVQCSRRFLCSRICWAISFFSSCMGCQMIQFIKKSKYHYPCIHFWQLITISDQPIIRIHKYPIITSQFAALSVFQNYYNPMQSHHSSNFGLTGSLRLHFNKDLSANQSSPSLFSSERFVGSVTQQRKQQKAKTSADIIFNLNSSLEGLFSKIDALKEEHSTRPKVADQGQDSSFTRFPKFNPQIKTPKVQPVFKPFQFIADNKAATPKAYTSPFTPQQASGPLQFRKNETRFQQKPKGMLYPQGLLDVPTMKASIDIREDVSPHNFKKTKNLEDMITKETMEESQIMMKSIIFEKKLGIEDFELGKCVGSGKFGDVFICRHKITGTLFALKKIFKSEIQSYNMIEQFTRELRIHYRLDHPNIIKLYTHFDDEYHLFLLMEYCEGGVLMNKLKCGEQAASRYIDQTIDAVEYLHRLKIAHRDIKPENIVLQLNTVKLCDFGWSNFYGNEMKTTFCGTLDYLSPEMKDRGIYDNSVDVWSIGVLTFELLTGNPPYKNQMQAWKALGNQKASNWNIRYPPSLSGVAQSFMRNILKVNPQERANLRMCSSHYFISKQREEAESSPYFEEFSRIV